MELKLLMSMLRKRWWVIAITVTVCSAAAGVYSQYFMTPQYEASNKLIVNKSNQDSLGNTLLDINVINTNIMLINSYKEIISSVAIMDKVVERIPELKLTSGDLMDRLKIITTQNSQIFTLKVTDVSYTRAMKIVNTISEVFKEEIPKIMQVDNVTILDVAKPSENTAPVTPRVKLNVAIVFLASLMVVIGIILLIEYLDDSMRSEQDIEEILDLRTLGTIPNIRKKDLRFASKISSKKQVGEPYAPIRQ